MAVPAPAPDRACMITGASSGIGEEFARQLAGRRHNLILVARREQPLRNLAQELSQRQGVRVEVAICDIGEDKQRERLSEQVAASGLQVQMLINNAGLSHAGDLDREPAEQLAMVRVNVEALVALTAAYLPAMVERREGAIINVGSLAGFLPLPALATYAATKAFVLNFSEALWAEVRSSGVTVTALCPGFVRTAFWEVGGFRRTVFGPSLVWSPVAAVVRAGIVGAERGRRVVVPGPLQRLAAGVAHYAPHPLLLGPLAWLWRWGIGERTR